jgi:hypothetical protein
MINLVFYTYLFTNNILDLGIRLVGWLQKQPWPIKKSLGQDHNIIQIHVKGTVTKRRMTKGRKTESRKNEHRMTTGRVAEGRLLPKIE